MDSLGKVFAIFLSVILFFVYPIYHISLKQENINRIFVTGEVIYFVDAVRNLGYFSKNMYDTFKRKINITGDMYQVEIIHYEKVLFEDEKEYKGHYYGIYTEDVLKNFEEEKYYKLKKGDFFSVKVYNKSKTMANKATELLLGKFLPQREAVAVYGGAVRDEAY